MGFFLLRQKTNLRLEQNTPSASLIISKTMEKNPIDTLPIITYEKPMQIDTTITPTRIQATASPQSSLRGEIIIWHPFTLGSNEAENLNSIVGEFSAENPELNIILLELPASEIVRDYILDVLAGSGPDILLSSTSEISNWVKDDLVGLLPPEHSKLMMGWDDRIIQGVKVDGELYAVPYMESTIVLYYNKELVQIPPWNTVELLEMITNGKPMSIFLDPYFLYGWSLAFGGQLMDENGDCMATKSGWEEYLNYLLALQNSGALFENRFQEAERLFLEGQTGMFIGESRFSSNYREVLGNSLGIVPLPVGPQGQAEPFSLLTGFFINPNPENFEAVTRFLDFLISKNLSAGEFNSILTNPTQENSQGNDSEDAVIYNALTMSQPYPHSGIGSNYEIVFGEMFIEVLNGRTSPQTALQEACQQMDIVMRMQ